jgi:hypothetical protein
LASLGRVTLEEYADEIQIADLGRFRLSGLCVSHETRQVESLGGAEGTAMASWKLFYRAGLCGAAGVRTFQRVCIQSQR